MNYRITKVHCCRKCHYILDFKTDETFPDPWLRNDYLPKETHRHGGYSTHILITTINDFIKFK